jgi:hypothetical protein
MLRYYLVVHQGLFWIDIAGVRTEGWNLEIDSKLMLPRKITPPCQSGQVGGKSALAMLLAPVVQ